MFNHKYKTFNADNFKTVHTERLLVKDWTTEVTRWRAVVTKCDERAKQATKFENVVTIENRRKSEATKLEAAKVEVLMYTYCTSLNYFEVFQLRAHNITWQEVLRH
jgi:hypothetical protein